MVTEFQHFIRQEKLFFHSDRILLAISGGMDSVAMAELFRRSGYHFGIAHCNFSLRGKESDAEEEFVRELAEDCRVTIHVKRFDTGSFAREKKISIQMAARDLRYEWFEEILSEHGYRYVATAHHLDDQIETFLINLSRGTGIAGLHGILPRSGNLIRPMLFTTRENIEQFIRSENLAFCEDSSNREIKYLRNRIRHKIIPQLEKINPGFRQDINQTILKIREAETIYRQAIAEKSSQLLIRRGNEIRISLEAFFSLDPFQTWAFELLQPFGFNTATIEMLAATSAKEPGKVFYSSSHRLLLDRDFLIITLLDKTQAGSDMEATPILLEKPSGSLEYPVKLSWSVSQIPVEFPDTPQVAFLDFDRLKFPLEIRKWKQGDYFYPLGMTRKKKLSDFFIDQKLSIVEKERTLLLCSKGEIAWVIGHRMDDRFKITDGTRKVFRIQSEMET